MVRASVHCSLCRRQLRVGQEPVFEVCNNRETDLSKAVDLTAKEADGFSRLFVLGKLGIVLVRNAEIVSDDMALLDVEGKKIEISLRERRKRVDGKNGKVFAGAVDVLEDDLPR